MEFLLFTFPIFYACFSFVFGNGKSRKLEYGLRVNNGYNALNS